MNRLLLLFVLCTVVFYSCEDIYQPKLEEMDEMLVIEARLVYGQSSNYVRLFKTIGFNDLKKTYPPVQGASVSLKDDQGVTLSLKETEKGSYLLTQTLVPSRKYRLLVATGGEEYASPLQPVPAVPSIDQVYLLPAEQFAEGTTDQSASNLQKRKGAEIYADIDGKGDARYYRFSGRMTAQFLLSKVPGELTANIVPVYFWYSLSPPEPFNLAAPPEYSVSDDIRKHPLVFLEKNINLIIPDTITTFMGWIYICNQYAITEQTYRYYNDLKKQLSASGKLFDPLYTQARGNLSCTTHPEKIVLGNFEIASVREYRFYVVNAGGDLYYFRKIPYFWDIPQRGKIPEQPPVWWEFKEKEYPAGSFNIPEKLTSP